MSEQAPGEGSGIVFNKPGKVMKDLLAGKPPRIMALDAAYAEKHPHTAMLLKDLGAAAMKLMRDGPPKAT